MSNVKIFPNRLPGERIKIERLRLGIDTQVLAATKFGVKRETWSRYESGKLEMGKEVFRRFIKAGADADYLFTGIAKAVFEVPAEKSMPLHMQSDVKGREAALLRHWSFLPEPLQAQVSDLVEAIAEKSMPTHMRRDEVGRQAAEGREAALLRHWRSLPEPLQTQVSDLAETLANLYLRGGKQ